MNARYTYEEENGNGIHKVVLHENYDTFMGLVGDPVVVSEGSNYNEVLKEVRPYLSDEVIDMLESLFKSRLSGTVTSDGKYHNV